MSKICTDLEQSRKLLSLGLEPHVGIRIQKIAEKLEAREVY